MIIGCGRNRILCFSRCTLTVFFLVIVRVKSCISFTCALKGLPAGRQALSLTLTFWFVRCNVFYFHFDLFLFPHIPLKPKHCCASTFRKKSIFRGRATSKKKTTGGLGTHPQRVRTFDTKYGQVVARNFATVA